MTIWKDVFDDCLDWEIKLSIVVIINLLLRGQEAKIGKYEKDDEFFEYCAIWKIFRLQYRCK